MDAHMRRFGDAVVDHAVSTVIQHAVSGIPEPLTRFAVGWAAKESIEWLRTQTGNLDVLGSAAELEELRALMGAPCAGTRRPGRAWTGRRRPRAGKLSAMARLLDHLTDQPPDPATDLCDFPAWRDTYDALCAVLAEVNYAFACQAEAAREAECWKKLQECAVMHVQCRWWWPWGYTRVHNHRPPTDREAHCWQQLQECALLHLERRWWHGPGWAPPKPLPELCTALKPFCDQQLYAQLSTALRVMPRPEPPSIRAQSGTLPEMQRTHDIPAIAARARLRSEPSLTEHVVQHGDDLIPQIEGMLDDVSTRNIGIVGMGGVGKTTIARAVYEFARRGKKFDHFVWLNVGHDATSRAAVYQRLQAATDELFPGMDVTSIHSDEVLADLAKRLLGAKYNTHRVLLVLDDVWYTAGCAIVAALNFATRSESRAEGSRLIVTTRDKATLSYHPGEMPVQPMADLEIVTVEPLEPEPARQLFYHHAYGDNAAAALEQSAQQDHVRIHDVCRQLINECGGNPLALEVTGAALRYCPEEEWEQRLEILRARRGEREDEVTDKCAVSVDALPASLWECFVDFAAFPEDARVPEPDLVHLFATHAPLHTPEAVRCAELKLLQLVQRSLVSVEVDDHVPEPMYYMHDILRSIAVCEAKAKQSGRWFYAGSDSNRSTTVRSFSLVAPAPLNAALTGGGVDTNQLYACVMSHTKPQPPPKQKYFGGCDRAVHWPSMSRLRYLHCAALRNPEDTEGLFSRLEAGARMPQLNFATFRACKDVSALLKVMLPAAQLVHLDLRACKRLTLLPDSIGCCSQLAHLDLSRCRHLRHLPDSICDCSHLTRIRLNACLRFTHLPERIGCCAELARLDLRAAGKMEELPRSLGDCRKLQHLDLCACKRLTELPQTITRCAELSHLDISRTGITDLPPDLRHCTRMTNFSFSESCLAVLPEAFRHFRQLVYLDVSESDCLAHVLGDVLERDSAAAGVDEALTAGATSSAAFLQAAARVAAPAADYWRHLQHLDLSDCVNLEELPAATLSWCSTLTQLNLSGCAALTRLPDSIESCANLAHLDLSECSSLERLPDGIAGCTGLTHLMLGRCCEIERLPDGLGLCQRLVELHLWYCDKLQELPGRICECSQLAVLNLSLCSRLRHVPEGLGRCDKLVKVDMSHCDKVVWLPDSITRCSRLADLNLGECHSLVGLPQGISACTALRRLCLDRCLELKRKLPSLARCTRLRQVDLRDVRLEFVPELPECARVRLQYVDD